MNKKLYKSATDKKIDGVCGGLAEYLGIDSSIIRLIWIFFSCVGGSGILAYIICSVVIPRAPVHYSDLPPREYPDQDHPNRN